MGIAGYFPVVEFERVTGHGVGHGRVPGRGAQRAAEDRCYAVIADEACLTQCLAGLLRHRFAGPGEHAAVNVDQCIAQEAEALLRGAQIAPRGVFGDA